PNAARKRTPPFSGSRARWVNSRRAAESSFGPRPEPTPPETGLAPGPRVCPFRSKPCPRRLRGQATQVKAAQRVGSLRDFHGNLFIVRGAKKCGETPRIDGRQASPGHDQGKTSSKRGLLRKRGRWDPLHKVSRPVHKEIGRAYATAQPRT